MADIFPLEGSLFYLDLDTTYTPLITRARATDGSISTVELAPRTLWSAQDIKCRVLTSAEFNSFETFYNAHRSTTFTIYDPVHSAQFEELIGSGNASTKIYFTDHTFVASGTLLVYVNAVLQTETTNYTVDYDAGEITFVVAPPSGHDILTSYRFRRQDVMSRWVR